MTRRRRVWTALFLLGAASLAGAQEHPLIQPVPGSELAGSPKLDDDGEMVLTYRDEGGRQRETIRGRYWSIEYRVTGEMTSEAIVAHFTAESERFDGTIHREADNRLTFSFEREDGGTTWCEVWAANRSYTLDIVDEAPASSEPNDPEPTEVLLARIDFATESAELAPGSGAVLDELVRRLLSEPELRLRARGFQTPSESSGLSERRAQVVARALALYGIASERIVMSADGFKDTGRVELTELR